MVIYFRKKACHNAVILQRCEDRRPPSSSSFSLALAGAGAQSSKKILYLWGQAWRNRLAARQVQGFLGPRFAVELSNDQGSRFAGARARGSKGTGEQRVRRARTLMERVGVGPRPALTVQRVGCILLSTDHSSQRKSTVRSRTHVVELNRSYMQQCVFCRQKFANLQDPAEGSVQISSGWRDQAESRREEWRSRDAHQFAPNDHGTVTDWAPL